MTALSHLAALLPPEPAHQLALRWLRWRARLVPPVVTPDPPNPFPRLATTVAGIAFRNPLGIAAGLDKDARAIDGLLALGVGGVEVGTLTPRPQPGNPRPRLFRLAADGAVINRMGFNNGGLAAALPRVSSAGGWPGAGRVGINVGVNKDAVDRIADYAAGVAAAAPVAAWVTINVSSPNTPGLRDLQHGAALRDLLAACDAVRGDTPLFLKVAPDLLPAEVDDLAAAALEGGIAALVVGNTTVSRPPLRSAHREQAGGLSGAPLAALARQRLADFRTATGGALPLVAAGGIGAGAEAYARIRAGASLVQLYTALVFDGPGLPSHILRDLDALLARDGFASVGEAVGAG